MEMNEKEKIYDLESMNEKNRLMEIFKKENKELSDIEDEISRLSRVVVSSKDKLKCFEIVETIAYLTVSMQSLLYTFQASLQRVQKDLKISVLLQKREKELSLLSDRMKDLRESLKLLQSYIYIQRFKLS
ncbi:hypothetical protein [Veillonella denticariosi]|jgi:hypothetical protein|uniref:hypothetical protein n=1 Tax=Veillonella denticariosi TaxID=419208 RepID=UPI0024933267|nr:hypothetical protein [Veillonella denticariosi]